MEDKFSKFSLYVFIFGVIIALYMIINSILHGNVGSFIQNKTLTPNQMIGPNAKY